MAIYSEQTSPLIHDENGITVQEGYRNMQSGRITVATAGTKIQLDSTPTQVKRLDITADYLNTDFIVIGGSGVIGNATTRKGVPLSAGSTYTFYVTDLSQIWADAGANNQSATYNYFW